MEDSQYRQLLRAADKWQEEQLAKLADRPFEELSKLPERSPLKPPAKLANFNFIVHRGVGDSGGVEIAVQRVFSDPECESRQGPWFEILPSGRIVDSSCPVREKPLRESAPWMGTTGLGAAVERELSRYLRRELGESSSDPDALKASQLEYLGRFAEEEGQIHYWRVPYGRKKVYAYVIRSRRQTSFGWGDRKPKKVGHAV